MRPVPRAALAVMLAACGHATPATSSAPPIANQQISSSAKQDALACVAQPPSIDTSALVGLVIPFPYDHLTGPWHPSSDWPTGKYIVAMANAHDQPGDQIAFIVETEEWTPHGHIRRTVGALGVGSVCWDTISTSCTVDGVADASVFAQLKGTIMCPLYPTPVVRAWRAGPDGRIVNVPAERVACGRQDCD